MHDDLESLLQKKNSNWVFFWHFKFWTRGQKAQQGSESEVGAARPVVYENMFVIFFFWLDNISDDGPTCRPITQRKDCRHILWCVQLLLTIHTIWYWANSSGSVVLLDVKPRCRGDLLDTNGLCLMSYIVMSLISSKARWVGPLLGMYVLNESWVCIVTEHSIAWMNSNSAEKKLRKKCWVCTELCW